MKIATFLGAPGSGKGTQAKRLSERFGFKHFSTGDMLRAAIKTGSDLGKKAKGYIDRGELVPDSVMIELIEDALKVLPASSQVILDGFPRTVPQAVALDKSPGTTVTIALYFKVSPATLITRLTGRRICEHCGEPFHVTLMPPTKEGICNKCGGNLIQRSDDKEDVVKRRLEVFTQQNTQLLDYYLSHQKLKELDGDRNVDLLQNELLNFLG